MLSKFYVFFTIRENFLKDGGDSDALMTLSSIISLAEKMEENEVRSGYLCRVSCIVFAFLTRLNELQADVVILHYCVSDLQRVGTGSGRLHGDDVCRPTCCNCSQQTV